MPRLEAIEPVTRIAPFFASIIAGRTFWIAQNTLSQVDPDGLLETRRVERDERGEAAGQPGIGEQRLDRAEMRRGGIERGVELVLLADVGGKARGVVADLGRLLVEHLLAPRDQRDLARRVRPAVSR